MQLFKHFLAIALGAALTTDALAQNVTITDAWVRATVPGQQATGAFMKITAKESTQLMAISSPAAGVIEIHEMKMDKDIMRMTALPNGLDLPAGKTVELKPGGYHLMLMDLKTPLAKDTTVAMTLTLRNASGIASRVELQVPVTRPPVHHHPH